MSTISIKEFDDILDALEQRGEKYWYVSKEQANRTMFEAYYRSKEHALSLLNFDEVIWNDDIQPIAETCRRLGIKQFTISAGLGNIADVLAEFQDLGIVIQGMTKIHAKKISGEREYNAFLLEVQD